MSIAGLLWKALRSCTQPCEVFCCPVSFDLRRQPLFRGSRAGAMWPGTANNIRGYVSRSRVGAMWPRTANYIRGYVSMDDDSVGGLPSSVTISLEEVSAPNGSRPLPMMEALSLGGGHPLGTGEEWQERGQVHSHVVAWGVDENGNFVPEVESADTRMDVEYVPEDGTVEPAGHLQWGVVELVD